MRFVLVVDGSVRQIFDTDPQLPTGEGVPGAQGLEVVEASDDVESGWLYDGEGFSAPVAIPELTPEEKREQMPNLTARQLRLGLLHMGKLNDVPTSIATLPEPDKSQAEIEWQFASEFRRLHPLIVQLIPLLSLTDDQVDTVWQQFSTV